MDDDSSLGDMMFQYAFHAEYDMDATQIAPASDVFQPGGVDE